MSLAIEVKNVSKEFGLLIKKSKSSISQNHLALNGISFQIEKGSFVGIIGPNGCGKSTLLRLIAGILQPSSGEISISGRLASLISLGSGFHQDFTGIENVFQIGRLLGFSKHEVNSRINDIIDFSELGDFINEKVRSYSNGMFLRLAFSIYTHLEFDIYLFDEVLSVGDYDFSLKCKRRIDELIQGKKTIVIASHNLNDLNHCNQFIELSNGLLINTGMNSSILRNYINGVLDKKGLSNYTSEFKLLDFTQFKIKLDIIQIISISVYQSKEKKLQFSTNESTHICFELLKLTPDVIDLILYLTDLAGEVVFVSSDLFFSEPKKSQTPGKYTYTCIIPPNLLAPIDYSISAVIVKNTFLFNDPFGDDILNNVDEQDVYGLVADLKDFARIKMKFSFVGFKNLEALSLPVGKVLPSLEWKIEKKG